MKLWNDRVVIKNEEIVDFVRHRDKKFLKAFEEKMCKFIRTNVCSHCCKVLTTGPRKIEHEQTCAHQYPQLWGDFFSWIPGHFTN